ncbi:MAG: anaerobic glycerol-3-phosphate dehydrogenase subunit A, partial [Actinomycetaceae bacterium]|nr:anaerobic glycerol-3-phosphate dehydrogenase subunit A [Actinomycetaceae bacterium]
MSTTKLSCDIVVIGGGVTGVGIIRDAAMRGFSTVLCERADLAQGTSARYHGLLHSGGRYVVTDPKSATECATENAIIRAIHPDAVEETGGLFISLDGDDAQWPERFIQGGRETGVEIEEITVAHALSLEPRLTPRIARAFQVADASVDAWAMVWGAAASAQDYGARIMPYTEVIEIHQDGSRVTGVRAYDTKNERSYDIECRFVVNAAGPWAGRVAALAGCTDIEVVPGRGVMIAMNHRLTERVINRCTKPGDGDIIVPAHTVSIIGTTDTRAENPDRLGIPADDVQQMLSAGEELIPDFRAARPLHVWSGARPLLRDTRVSAEDTRHMSRDMSIHRHDLEGFITIAGGKLTTYRLMAEKALDAICEMLGESRPCRTASEAVVTGKTHAITDRLARVEQAKKADAGKPATDPVICECELVTRSMIEELFDDNPKATFDDIRRQSRLGMGPCQGTFCASRLAGITCEKGVWSAEEATELLRLFLKNRWGGLHPILYGATAREAALTEWLYRGNYSLDDVPAAPLPPGSELLSATEFLNRGGKGEAVPPRPLSPAD